MDDWTTSELDFYFAYDDVIMWCCMCNKSLGEVVTYTGASRMAREHARDVHKYANWEEI